MRENLGWNIIKQVKTIQYDGNLWAAMFTANLCERDGDAHVCPHTWAWVWWPEIDGRPPSQLLPVMRQVSYWTWSSPIELDWFWPINSRDLPICAPRSPAPAPAPAPRPTLLWWGYRPMPPHLPFSVGAGDSNAGPQAWIAHALLTDPSPCPLQNRLEGKGQEKHQRTGI